MLAAGNSTWTCLIHHQQLMGANTTKKAREMGGWKNLLTDNAHRTNDKLHLEVTVVRNVTGPWSMDSWKVFYTQISAIHKMLHCKMVLDLSCTIQLFLLSLCKCDCNQKLQLKPNTTMLGGSTMNTSPTFEGLVKFCRADNISFRLKIMCVIHKKSQSLPFFYRMLFLRRLLFENSYIKSVLDCSDLFRQM